MKYKSEYTEMEYLDSIQKKYKSEYEKNKILRAENGLLKFEKNNLD